MVEKGFLDKLTNGLGLPAEVTPGNSLVELIGDRRVLVEQHRGICVYSRCEVVVKIPLGRLHICGMGLVIQSITSRCLVVSGRIDALSISREGGV